MSRCVRTLCLVILATLALAGARPLLAADTERVEVRVTFVSGNAVYLDKGADDGIQVGDLLEITLSDGATIEGRVDRVATHTCRARLASTARPPAVNANGLVVLATTKIDTPKAEPELKRPTVEHPPWESRDGKLPDGTPLLAPSTYQRPSDRPLRISGRAYLDLLADFDRGHGRDTTYTSSRVGTDITAENPFDLGGTLRFAGTLSRRESDFGDGVSEVASDLRLDRLSYRWGGGFDGALELQFGRFVPRDMSDFGLIDGVAASVKTGRHTRLGIGLGALPEPFPDRQSFRDLSSALTWRWTESEKERLMAQIGAQQTWHEGERDRQLVTTRVAYRPTNSLHLTGTARIDHYDGSETIKQPGFELTEARLRGRWTYQPGHGIGAAYSRTRRPELLRNEFVFVNADVLENDLRERVELSLFNKLSTHLRLDARVSQWSDAENDGINGSVTLRADDVLNSGVQVAVTALRSEGVYSDGSTGRLTVSSALGAAYWSLSYEQRRQEYASTVFGAVQGDLVEHALELNLDYRLDSHWTLSLSGSHRFGDDLDASGLGLLVQYRF